MLDFLPAAVRLRGVAEAVVADDAAGVQDDAVADYRTREDVDAGVDDAVAADAGALADGHVIEDAGTLPHLRLLSDGHEVAHPHALTYFGAPGDAAAAAVAAVSLFLVIDILEQVGKGVIGVRHPDEGRRNRLLRGEVVVDENYRSLALIDIVLVFGIGEEAELAGLALFNLGERGDGGLRVALYAAPEHLGQLFSCKFHRLNQNLYLFRTSSPQSGQDSRDCGQSLPQAKPHPGAYRPCHIRRSRNTGRP